MNKIALAAQIDNFVPAYTVIDGNSGNNYTVTTVTNMTGVIINPIDHFVLVPTTSSATAGVGLAMLVIAENASNQPVNFGGLVTLTSNDPQAHSEGTVTLAGGYAATVVALDTATSAGWTVTATVDAVSTTTGAITVSPGAATSFLITAPSTATTGSAFGVTVKARDVRQYRHWLHRHRQIYQHGRRLCSSQQLYVYRLWRGPG